VTLIKFDSILVGEKKERERGFRGFRGIHENS
jgi:hypothetical protein